MCWLFLFQLCRTILDSDDRTQKVEYLEIGVYRTTPLMPDRGLVGDNRSSKVFEFATFSSSTQSRRDFFSLSFHLFPLPRRRRTKFVRVISLYSRDPLFFFLFRICAISLFLAPFFFRLFDAESVRSFTCVLHIVAPVNIRYTVVDTVRFVVAVVHGRRQAAFRWRLRFDVW